MEQPTLWKDLTEDEKHFAYYHQLLGELKEFRRNLANKSRIVEEWDSEPRGDTLAYSPVAATVTTLTPLKAYHSDVVIESITAGYPTASSSVTLTLGNRVLTLPATAGIVNLVDLKIQLEYEDDRILRVAPAGACFLILSGYADAARPGRRGGQRG